MNARIQRPDEFIERLRDLAYTGGKFSLIVAPQESRLSDYERMFSGWGGKPKVFLVCRNYSHKTISFQANIGKIHILRARDLTRHQLKGCVGPQCHQQILAMLSRSYFNTVTGEGSILMRDDDFVVLLELEGIPDQRPA